MTVLRNSLLAEGHDIEIFTFTLQYPKLLFPGKTQFTDGTEPENIKIVRHLNSINPFNWISTGMKIKKERPDILLITVLVAFHGTLLRDNSTDSEDRTDIQR